MITAWDLQKVRKTTDIYCQCRDVRQVWRRDHIPGGEDTGRSRGPRHHTHLLSEGSKAAAVRRRKPLRGSCFNINPTWAAIQQPRPVGGGEKLKVQVIETTQTKLGANHHRQSPHQLGIPRPPVILGLRRQTCVNRSTRPPPSTRAISCWRQPAHQRPDQSGRKPRIRR